MANVKRPLKADPKVDWVAYAIDRGRPSYEAWALTIEELHDEYGAPEPKPEPKPKARPTRG